VRARAPSVAYEPSLTTRRTPPSSARTAPPRSPHLAARRRRQPPSAVVHRPLGPLSAQSSHSTAFLPPRRVSPMPPLGLVVDESALPRCPAPGRRAARCRHGSGDRRVPSRGPSYYACARTRTCRWLGANAARARESAGFGRLRRPHPPSPPSTPSATPPSRQEPLIEFAITSSLFRAKAQSKWSPGALFQSTPAVSPSHAAVSPRQRRRQFPPNSRSRRIQI